MIYFEIIVAFFMIFSIFSINKVCLGFFDQKKHYKLLHLYIKKYNNA